MWLHGVTSSEMGSRLWDRTEKVWLEEAAILVGGGGRASAVERANTLGGGIGHRKCGLEEATVILGPRARAGMGLWSQQLLVVGWGRASAGLTRQQSSWG